MLTEIDKNITESLTYNQNIFLHGVINLNRRDLCLSFDLDQVLAISEIPVIEFCSKDLGINYLGRKLEGFYTISRWISDDGIMSSQDAINYEKKIWEKPEQIMSAPPNEVLRGFSYTAYLRGIPQFVTTTRVSGLRDVTYSWLAEYFPWISQACINQRSDNTLDGQIYKVMKVAEIFDAHFESVHFDDSVEVIRKIIRIVPNIGIIGFPYSRDSVLDLAGDKQVFLRRKSFEELLYYRPLNIPSVAQSH